MGGPCLIALTELIEIAAMNENNSTGHNDDKLQRQCENVYDLQVFGSYNFFVVIGKNMYWTYGRSTYR